MADADARAYYAQIQEGWVFKPLKKVHFKNKAETLAQQLTAAGFFEQGEALASGAMRATLPTIASAAACAISAPIVVSRVVAQDCTFSSIVSALLPALVSSFRSASRSPALS